MTAQKLLLILAFICALLAVFWGSIGWAENNRVGRADLVALALAFYFASLIF